MPAGQVVAGALVGWAATAGWSFADRFWLAAVFCAVLAAATWSAARRPEQELHAVLYPDGVDDADKAGAGKAGADKENGLVGWEVYLAAWSGSADRRGDRSRMIAAESAHLELT